MKNLRVVSDSGKPKQPQHPLVACRNELLAMSNAASLAHGMVAAGELGAAQAMLDQIQLRCLRIVRETALAGAAATSHASENASALCSGGAAAKALALCDEILDRSERTQRMLSEALDGLRAACDEILSKTQQGTPP